MKTKLSSLFILLFLIVPCICTGCITSYSAESIRNNYEAMQKEFAADIESIKSLKDMNENEELAKAYSDIFKKISKGDRNLAAEYAKLFNEITKQGTTTEDNVFEIAADHAEILEKMSDGFDDFGIQAVYSDNGIIKIKCIGGYGYSIKRLSSEDKDYRDDMGKYVTAIYFSDIRKSNKLCEEYPDMSPCIVDGSKNVKVAFEYLDDSITAVYIGSDEDLNIKDTPFTEFTYISETLNIS